MGYTWILLGVVITSPDEHESSILGEFKNGRQCYEARMSLVEPLRHTAMSQTSEFICFKVKKDKIST